VIPLVDEVTDRARTIGAVNTLYWRDHKLVGGNTDALGFLAPIRRRTFASALVLGAGGASRAVLAGLLELGVRDVFLSNRSPQRARDLAEEFGVRAVDWDERTACDAELLVNTTPLGMAGENKSATPWPAQAFSKGQTAYDLVYNPMRTRFLCEAEAAGCATVDGLSMFIGQAQAQFGLWTGNEFSLDEGRSFLIATLGAAG
jgi:shikimate dehydrogenase